MSLGLLSALFGGYLTGYYSILMSYYAENGWNNQENRSQTMNTSFILICINLALSFFIVLFGILSFLLGFYGIKGGTKKGLHLEDKYMPFIENSSPKGNYEEMNFFSKF